MPDYSNGWPLNVCMTCLYRSGIRAVTYTLNHWWGAEYYHDSFLMSSLRERLLD